MHRLTVARVYGATRPCALAQSVITGVEGRATQEGKGGGGTTRDPQHPTGPRPKKVPQHHRNRRIEETSPVSCHQSGALASHPSRGHVSGKGGLRGGGCIARDSSKETSTLEHAHLDVQLAAIVLVAIVAIAAVAPAFPPQPFPRGLPPPLALPAAAAATTCRERGAGVNFVLGSRMG